MPKKFVFHCGRTCKKKENRYEKHDKKRSKKTVAPFEGAMNYMARIRDYEGSTKG